MPIDYRFDELDLHEEPARGLAPEMVPYTNEDNTRANCSLECCSYTCYSTAIYGC
ncbi:MAG: hypothetical protein QOI11_1208 [Candidatus Eremiobacteraeota bacterium]|jgi:hypothetical protein|nr:hypothetical protein [Candidatus Eremiobacteraeota bacterium]